MRIPYAVQGALFAPVLATLVFFLKLSCPASGSGCFGDVFIRSVFLPLPFIDQVLGSRYSFIQTHEPFVILVYWMFVGFLVGVLCDLLKQPNRARGSSIDFRFDL